jgi:hypothetical protein
MDPWKQYRRKGLSQMRPYIEGETLSERVSISQADKDAGSPKLGDMIARNPKIPDDQWLVAKAYFEDNLELVPDGPVTAEHWPENKV